MQPQFKPIAIKSMTLEKQGAINSNIDSSFERWKNHEYSRKESGELYVIHVFAMFDLASRRQQ